jgi:hypothetical protein
VAIVGRIVAVGCCHVAVEKLLRHDEIHGLNIFSKKNSVTLIGSCRFFCNFAAHKGIIDTEKVKTLWVASLAQSLQRTA